MYVTSLCCQSEKGSSGIIAEIDGICNVPNLGTIRGSEMKGG
jgi:hypothetical protein